MVLSACVQMPSLGAIEEAEQRLGKPVVSAAGCTAHQLLRALGLDAVAPGTCSRARTHGRRCPGRPVGPAGGLDKISTACLAVAAHRR
ncbi:hypothetical protein [Streptomyces sp. G-G2]|uniref:hypothetical protein n=1 Tax=Streptomyces sp. G-G2 TaxID=3046201 RepID=UPI0024B9DC1F|nr:hypothetical protein [Streptomyces sp. G-G2]MDJ0381986.1 hypothetical protein [Streptomyces sp. G-G2]